MTDHCARPTTGEGPAIPAARFPERAASAPITGRSQPRPSRVHVAHRVRFSAVSVSCDGCPDWHTGLDSGHDVADLARLAAMHAGDLTAPPDGTASRELLGVIRAALNLPYPAGQADRLPYLILRSKRASLAMEAIDRLTADREAAPPDQLAAARALTAQLADYPADGYRHSGLGS